MKHQISGSKLGRSAPQRRSLRRNLLKALFEHERIKTTEAKAKFIRSDAEKLITLAKRGNKANTGVNLITTKTIDIKFTSLLLDQF